ncbi:unnamed protein product [Adineta steineri]|uniref:Glycosyltransferase family 92 protein n=1 Tax=Adineta steineri TaxID=433720 RepID=A0A815L882_9BILA|nr:unnamed protein product [Adineta steineri]
MLRRADFWKEEDEAPLLRLNRSFLPSEKIVDKIEDNKEDDPIVNTDHERIIYLDAERTFLGTAQRTTLMNVLSFLRNDFGSYHQAMSYVSGFLLLTHSPSEVIETMRQLHRTVLIGYWTEEPVAFATDAYVFDYLLADYDPELHKHLLNNYIFPETYAQKWFTTLCWIEFHRLVGFSKFVIYNTTDTGNYLSTVINMYNQKYHGLVDVVQWSFSTLRLVDFTRTRYFQVEALHDCLIRYGDQSEWLGTLDLDEYVVPLPPYETIVDYIHENFGRLIIGSINLWSQFFCNKNASAYTADENDTNHLTIERFTFRAPNRLKRGRQKYLYRPRFVQYLSIHRQVIGLSKEQPSEKHIMLAHYVFMTRLRAMSGCGLNETVEDISVRNRFANKNKTIILNDSKECYIILHERSGRLGNRLFMFASAYGLSLAHSLSDDKNYCRKTFNQNKNVLVTPDSFSAADDLAILALSQHTILTAGTFGWWGAFLSQNRLGDVLTDSKADHTPIDSNCRQDDYFPSWFSFLNSTN